MVLGKSSKLRPQSPATRNYAEFGGHHASHKPCLPYPAVHAVKLLLLFVACWDTEPLANRVRDDAIGIRLLSGRCFLCGYKLRSVYLRLLYGLEVAIKRGCAEPEARLVSFRRADHRQRVGKQVVGADGAVLDD